MTEYESLEKELGKVNRELAELRKRYESLESYEKYIYRQLDKLDEENEHENESK